MAHYDDWKTTPPAMPSGNGRTEHPYRCAVCAQLFDATEAVRHNHATAHSLTRRGVVQVFSSSATGLNTAETTLGEMI